MLFQFDIKSLEVQMKEQSALRVNEVEVGRGGGEGRWFPWVSLSDFPK